MIEGVVTIERESIITLELLGPRGQCCDIDVVIDTGFNHCLTLPADTIAELELQFEAPAQATLADGSIVPIQVYRGTVIWDGDEREIPVLSCDGGALIGMSMLEGMELRMQVSDGGAVAIWKEDQMP